MFTNALEAMDLSGIVFTGKPRQYRSDCQAGQFKIGATQFVGKSLRMEILAWRTFDDELFGYPHQTWLELIFIDPSNVVSHILFKTESLDNFTNMAIDLSQNGIAIGSVIVEAKMEKRSSQTNGNSYFAVEFSNSPQDPDRFQEILSFVQSINLNGLSIGSSSPAELPAAQ